jgi:hypothetical protein
VSDKRLSHLGITSDVDLTPTGVDLVAGKVATVDTHGGLSVDCRKELYSQERVNGSR